MAAGPAAQDRTAAARMAERTPLAIRFVNTVAWRRRDPPEERLPDTDAVLAFLAEAGLVAEGTAAALRSLFESDPAAGRAAHRAAIAAREAIHAALTARPGAGPGPEAALARLNRMLQAPAMEARIGWTPHGVRWQVGGLPKVDALLRPILLSAVALMTGPAAGRVKRCEDDRGCGWLFVDDSRAQNRRWCSMGDCGNRAKARRHYQRARGRTSGGSGPATA
jgi:predicted RNA-binding Zn ribbon-like protein